MRVPALPVPGQGAPSPRGRGAELSVNSSVGADVNAEARVTETERETFWEGAATSRPGASQVAIWSRPRSGDFATSGLTAPSLLSRGESTLGARGA